MKDDLAKSQGKLESDVIHLRDENDDLIIRVVKAETWIAEQKVAQLVKKNVENAVRLRCLAFYGLVSSLLVGVGSIINQHWELARDATKAFWEVVIRRSL